MRRLAPFTLALLLLVTSCRMSQSVAPIVTRNVLEERVQAMLHGHRHPEAPGAIRSIGAHRLGAWLVVDVRLQHPVPAGFDYYLLLNTDQNSMTGYGAGANTGHGAGSDYWVAGFADWPGGDPDAIYDYTSGSSAGVTGHARHSVHGNSLLIMVPLSAIGNDDGNLTLWLGTTVNGEFIDDAGADSGDRVRDPDRPRVGGDLPS